MYLALSIFFGISVLIGLSLYFYPFTNNNNKKNKFNMLGIAIIIVSFLICLAIISNIPLNELLT